VKIHCSVLAEDAIKSAVKDFKTKQEAALQPSAGSTAGKEQA
jgi:NifU-like protein involved in Fe-S cluster formation